jgi:nucleotide-binding universal stress UspA family protein
MTANDTQSRRIVVGVDGSEQSKRALRWAAGLADAIDATLDAVTVWHIPVSYGWNYVPDEWSPEADATQCLEQSVEEVFGDRRPARLRLLVREGVAPKVLLELSSGATMLVLGSRGHGGFAGLLLGSVSAHCAEHAKCPVLVVHGEAEPPRWLPAESARGSLAR